MLLYALGFCGPGLQAWSPDTDDLAALKAHIAVLLPQGYSLESTSGPNGETTVTIDARRSAEPDRYRCFLVITIYPPMDREKWTRLHEKQQQLFDEFHRLEPQINQIPLVGDSRKAKTPEQKAVLDRLAAIRKEMPRDIADFWFRSLGLQFFAARTIKTDDSTYLTSNEYKAWLSFLKSLDAVLRAEKPPNE